MARPGKGARLYLRAGRVDHRTGRKIAAVYFIRDGQTNISTGCGPERLAEAEVALAEYMAAKRVAASATKRSADDPEDVLVADVVGLYAKEKGPLSADPKALAVRLAMILEWWGEKSLGDIRRSSCMAYVAHRVSQPIRSYKVGDAAPRVSEAGARRELEDLSAAVTWWAKEHALTRKPEFTYPVKPEGARDALSRSEAAALLWAAMGWRKGADGRWRRLSKSSIANRRHLRRFILLGLYTGSRPGVLPKLRWQAADDSAWVDLERGWIFRRGRREADHQRKRRPAFRIPRRLLAHLHRWRAMDERVSAEREAVGEEPITTVLHHGGRAIVGKIRKGYANVVVDAGVRDGVTPHWHRHTAATWLMEADVPAHRAAQYLGMTVKTLEKYYGHHRADFQNDVTEAISRGGRG